MRLQWSFVVLNASCYVVGVCRLYAHGLCMGSQRSHNSISTSTVTISPVQCMSAGEVLEQRSETSHTVRHLLSANCEPRSLNVPERTICVECCPQARNLSKVLKLASSKMRHHCRSNHLSDSEGEKDDRGVHGKNKSNSCDHEFASLISSMVTPLIVTVRRFKLPNVAGL